MFTPEAATFEFEASDATATFECRLDTGEWTPCTSARTITASEGSHTFAVRAAGPYGDRDDTPATWTYRFVLPRPEDLPAPPPGSPPGTPPGTPPVGTGPTPPRGPIGVSINEGAKYTDDRHVTVNVVWPLGAPTATLSNDGGFREARTLPVSSRIAWTLDSSGPERLPKTLYVRFGGTQTFQDDIILDQTNPDRDVGECRRVRRCRELRRRSYNCFNEPDLPHSNPRQGRDVGRREGAVRDQQQAPSDGASNLQAHHPREGHPRAQVRASPGSRGEPQPLALDSLADVAPHASGVFANASAARRGCFTASRVGPGGITVASGNCNARATLSR